MKDLKTILQQVEKKTSKYQSPISVIALLLILLVTVRVTAQQTPVFSEYTYNAMILNPAHAGLYSEAELVLSGSGFGTSIEGSPQTQTVTYNTSLNRGKMGLGGGFMADRIGVSSASKFFASYSYKLRFGHDYDQPRWFGLNPQVLSFGITAGVLSYSEDLMELGMQNDIEFAENLQTTVPVIGIGFLFNRRNLYAGISVPNILGNSWSGEKGINLSTPYYAYFGLRIFTDSMEEFMIKPNTLIKYEEGSPFQVDINVLLSYRQRIEAGIGYRSSSMFNFLAGFYAFDNLRFSYSYNYRTNNSPITNVHGLSLSFRFGRGYSGQTL
ncbi:PorP/SprF family type IX secretion system membrane protein [Robertkochia solimangrovi]|uniref:PorP/SprF family type IX secretion system membrane protein n=1 Tax=Robertkochia solimangrovi TaxID=2213046 RepID=UPI0011809AD7|nr:PorP/SprF family type IX secretion system membrane protein [Robertkochia solimangrovi]TRZ40994.1 hypothetical protein DMZ48_18555 [Robertkochia solimangrovi]